MNNENERQSARLMQLGRILDEDLGEEKVRERLIRLLLKVRNKRGHLVPLQANAAQRAYSENAGRKNIVLKARQMGVTTWVAARFFIATITRPGTLTVQVAHDQESAEEIFKIVHRFWANLPERLRTGALRRSRANVRQMSFPALDSEYRVETAADPEAGRGLTIQNLHCSEVARWPGDAAATLASLRAALTPGGEMVMESTPRGADGCFYEEWMRAEETGTVRHFFPWWWESEYRSPLRETVALSEEELRLQAVFGLDEEQIGYRRELQANFRGWMRQEYAEDAESCFLASGDCYFDVSAIDDRMRQLSIEGVEPVRGRAEFLPPVQGREYVIGADPAGGGSEGDFCCAQVLDVKSSMQCAESHAKMSTIEFAHELIGLSDRYHRAMIAVERNNHGHGVLAHLQQMGCERIFEQKNQAGWLTTGASRPRMLAEFAAAFAEAPELVNSLRLLREMRSFVRNKEGRSAAQSGSHDDCVMAMAVALGARGSG